jgi:hypothetical protein
MARVVDISCGSVDSNPMPGERMLFPKLSAGDAVLPQSALGSIETGKESG